MNNYGHRERQLRRLQETLYQMFRTALDHADDIEHCERLRNIRAMISTRLRYYSQERGE